MKLAGLALLAGILVFACLCSFTALYAGMALAAGEAVRLQVPYVGGLAADRMIRWVGGGTEEEIIVYGPLDHLDPDLVMIEDEKNGIVPWRPGIEVGDPDRRVPRGKPANGPTKWFFREPRYPNHTGVDISVRTGTPVYATMAGRVVFSGWSNVGYGYLVVIQNGDYQTYYAHHSQLLVQAGDVVQAGQTIALSGNTGNSTGPHVHYEVRYQGRPVDPCLYGACD